MKKRNSKKKNAAQKPRIAIFVEGGLVSGILANTKRIDFDIVDLEPNNRR